MIHFIQAEHCDYTATIESWGDGYIITCFDPNDEEIPVGCNDFATMREAVVIITHTVDAHRLAAGEWWAHDTAH